MIYLNNFNQIFLFKYLELNFFFHKNGSINYSLYFRDYKDKIKLISLSTSTLFNDSLKVQELISLFLEKVDIYKYYTFNQKGFLNSIEENIKNETLKHYLNISFYKNNLKKYEKER